MACPVCDHTMQNLGVEGRRVFWCPRCGTLKEPMVEGDNIESPSFIRHVIREGKIGGVPGIAYHSVVTCQFTVEKAGSGPIKVTLLEKKR